MKYCYYRKRCFKLRILNMMIIIDHWWLREFYSWYAIDLDYSWERSLWWGHIWKIQFFHRIYLSESIRKRLFLDKYIKQKQLLFRFVLFLDFWKYFFQIQHQKLTLDKLLNRLKTRTAFYIGTPNHTECNAHKSSS